MCVRIIDLESVKHLFCGYSGGDHTVGIAQDPLGVEVAAAEVVVAAILGRQ